MSEKKSPNTKDRPSSTKPEDGKCMKRKLFASSSPHSLDDEDRKVTPVKRKRGHSLLLDSPPPTSLCATPKGAVSTPQNRTPGIHSMPLSERQQLAIIMKMTDDTNNSDMTFKPESPAASSQLKRTPADKKILKRNERGETMLHLAAIKGDVKLTKKYIKAGADVNAQDYAGWTALHEACNHGWIDVARQLLKHGADVNARGLENDTPLHDASANGHRKLVELLLKHGAGSRLVNDKGKSPIDMASNDGIICMLKKEIFSSNSEYSSGDDPSDSTSPDSFYGYKEDETLPNLDEHAKNDLLTDKKSSSKSPDHKGHSPRLFMKFHHIKFNDSQPNESKEQLGPDCDEHSHYRSYSVTLGNDDPSSATFSPFHSTSSNGSDSNDAKLDIGQRLKTVDKLIENDSSVANSSAKAHSSCESSFRNHSPVISSHPCTLTNYSSLSQPLPGNAPDSPIPRLSAELDVIGDFTGPVVISDSSVTQDDLPIPSLKSEAGFWTSTSSTSLPSHDIHPPITDSQDDIPEVNKSDVPLLSSCDSIYSVANNDSVVSRSSDEQHQPQQRVSYLSLEEHRRSDVANAADSTCLSSSTDDNSASAKAIIPKVPPLKIIMPTKALVSPRETDSVDSTITKVSLPYVVNSADSANDEAASSYGYHVSYQSYHGADGYRGDVHTTDSASIADDKSIADSLGISENMDHTAIGSQGFSLSEADSVGADLCPTSLVSSDIAPSAISPSFVACTPGDLSIDEKPSSENEVSEGSTKDDKDERRITRSLRSHMTQLQQQKNDKGSDSNDASNGDSTKPSRDDTPSDEVVTVPPRKRKLRPKPEPPASDVPPPYPTSNYELPPNPYQIYLSFKRSISNRQGDLYIVYPKEPQGFKDYLMVNSTYVLQGNAASTLAVPTLSPPTSVTGTLHELFCQQEKARYKLRLQHLVEKEKLILSSEQERLRVHGRAARALANQHLPLSVCTVLKDEELNPVSDLDQLDDRDKNIRSRCNGRQLLSWLQDVDDKYDKLKELVILRHHHEAESLYAVQKMEWEWKMKATGLCDHNITPKIDDLHVPMVQVNSD